MTYSHVEQPANRITTIAAVGALHLAAFYAVVAGLTVAFTPNDEPLPFSATNTPVDPPPPPTEPARAHRQLDHPLSPQPAQPWHDPVVLPTGTFPLDPPTGSGGEGGPVERVDPLPRPTLAPIAPAKAARPLGRPGDWVGAADYPTAELRLDHAGTVGFRLSLGADGRVVGCTITASSGFPRLDETTCRLLTRRARFEPARDDQGLPVPGQFASAVHWQIPD